MKVIHIPTWDLAREIKKSGQTVHVTVECEYGKNVLEGKCMTLAHHVEEYKHLPSPCERSITLDLPRHAVIAISHLDWDVIGALASIFGKKAGEADFWRAVGFIDVHGPHHLYRFPQNVRDRMNAYWCWTSKHHRLPANQKEVTDVTHVIENHLDAVERILNGDREMIESGRNWERQLTRRVEKCLVKESDDLRIFVTNDVKCTSSYYSPKTNKMIPLIVEYNTSTKRIRMSSVDGSYNVVRFLVDHFGDEAGGKEGIACSPRNQEVEWDDWLSFLEKVETIYQNAA
jgi:hypothetical protein